MYNTSPNLTISDRTKFATNILNDWCFDKSLWISFHTSISSRIPSCSWLEYCRYGVKHKSINQSICICIALNCQAALYFMNNSPLDSDEPVRQRQVCTYNSLSNISLYRVGNRQCYGGSGFLVAGIHDLHSDFVGRS